VVPVPPQHSAPVQDAGPAATPSLPAPIQWIIPAGVYAVHWQPWQQPLTHVWL
jgi:hypothetical protein